MNPISNSDFPLRHLGPRPQDISAMLATLGYSSLDELSDATVPAAIRLPQPLKLPEPATEHEALAELRAIAGQNKVTRSFIGMGYHGTITPPVIQRNILENPGWYTSYTPYQAEISQGRLEALLNFQTMVADLTGLPVANASLLDEATAAAEAMAMAHAIAGTDDTKNTFFISSACHPQTIAVVQARAAALGLQTLVADESELLSPVPSAAPSCAPKGHGSIARGERSEPLAAIPPQAQPQRGDGTIPIRMDCLFGALLQYPATDGRIIDYTPHIENLHAAGAVAVVACDLLALTLIKEPGAMGADIAIGSAQRFGVPMGYGGPHAAFMATKNEYVRKMPGRLVGVSKDAAGHPAYRLTLQTREQHIRREKATSNICTAQVLLAIMAGMYAVYHGPEGLKAIAQRVHNMTASFAEAARDRLGRVVQAGFDSVYIDAGGLIQAERLVAAAAQSGVTVRQCLRDGIWIAFDETTTATDAMSLLNIIAGAPGPFALKEFPAFEDWDESYAKALSRTSPFLTHPVFNSYHSETEMLRYIKRLESRDLSLANAMIPLGSCTMKLNATAEMFPISWPEFANLHPFAPADQAKGYAKLFADLETWLAEITGFAAVSLQPNAGSQGEYAGLLVIRAYLEKIASGLPGVTVPNPGGTPPTRRDICLIPTSAHGTNPASAAAAGFRVIPVACDAAGNIDLDDLKNKAVEHADRLACIMVTYPSTHGVFEDHIKDICRIVHDHGGQVYMDGANMNAQVALTSPGTIGADVCHLNLHKTFCIPHGGGGPGVGPIAVAAHLAPFLPSRRPSIGVTECRSNGVAHADTPTLPHTDTTPIAPIAAAPFGSAGILPIPWMYIRMMGEPGLKLATQVAILNANYMAKRLEAHYPIVFKGQNGRCAHEFIIDCRQFEPSAGVKVEDIAKRLMDYSFHAPTMSWPEPGTLMIEPTESESREELDRFCDALIAIRQEIRAIEEGRADRLDNVLKNAPHTIEAVTATQWKHPYTREQAAFPVSALRTNKFWPAVARIDNPYGDRNLMCSCPPVVAETLFK